MDVDHNLSLFRKTILQIRQILVEGDNTALKIFILQIPAAYIFIKFTLL